MANISSVLIENFIVIQMNSFIHIQMANFVKYTVWRKSWKPIKFEGSRASVEWLERRTGSASRRCACTENVAILDALIGALIPISPSSSLPPHRPLSKLVVAAPGIKKIKRRFSNPESVRPGRTKIRLLCIHQARGNPTVEIVRISSFPLSRFISEDSRRSRSEVYPEAQEWTVRFKKIIAVNHTAILLSL